MKIGKKTLFVAMLIVIAVVAAEMYYLMSTRTVIIADGKRKVVYTRLKVVNDILFNAKIKVDENDIVEPSLESDLRYPRVIKVIRVDEKIDEKVETMKPKIIKRERSSANLRPVIYEKLRVSKNITRTKIVYHDGKEVKREVLESRNITKIEELLSLVDPKSKNVIKIYNLTKSPKMKMVATAYYPGDPLAWRDGTITFLGMKMERGIVAVDPNVIPLRTRVYIPGYGYGFAADTGRVIKGKRIDLGVTNVDEEKSWMHKTVTVYILGKAKGW